MRAVCCVLLLVLALAAAEHASTTPWNRIADGVLTLVNNEQLRRGRKEIELRDVDHEFKQRLGFLRLRGRITADGGWLSDITTARRVGDVASEREGDTVRLTAAVTWDDLRVGYRHFRLDIGTDFDGSVEVKVRDNKVSAMFAFTLVDGECKTTLEDIKVQDLDGIEVKITGLGFLDILGEYVGKWFIARRKDDILSMLEEMFKSSIPEHLDDFHCDEYATLLGVPL